MSIRNINKGIQYGSCSNWRCGLEIVWSSDIKGGVIDSAWMAQRGRLLREITKFITSGGKVPLPGCSGVCTLCHHHHNAPVPPHLLCMGDHQLRNFNRPIHKIFTESLHCIRHCVRMENIIIEFKWMFLMTIFAHVLYLGFIIYFSWFLVQFSSVSQSSLTLCDPKDCSTPGLPVHISVIAYLLLWAECLWPQWNGVFPAISINKDVTATSDSNCEFLSLKESRKNNVCYLAAISHSPRLALAPDCWDAYKRNDFSKTRLLDLSIHRKMLNSLTWNIWFSLINCNLLIFRPPAPCCKLLCNLTPPLPTVLSGSLEILSLGFEVLKIPTKQHNTQLLGCDYFFSLHSQNSCCSPNPACDGTWSSQPPEL